jgi:hypothetical protein
MKPHKHAELIKAWADGAEIQWKDSDGIWHDDDEPWWNEEGEFRIKPEKEKSVITSMQLNLQLRLERDGPLLRVIAAEVVK